MFVAHTVLTTEEKVVDGRSAILFATVAGVSLGLMTGGAEAVPPDRRRGLRLAILVRGCALIVLGILLALLQPPLAVILDYYGLGFVLLAPVLFAARPVLAAALVVLAAAAPPLVAWLAATGDAADLPLPVQPLGLWLVYGSYPVLIWLAFLVAGLLVARMDLRRRATQFVLVVGGVVLATLGYGAAELVPRVTAEAHSGTTAEVVGSGGVALAVIGLAVLLGSLPGLAGRAVRLGLRPLASTGSMVLTLYTVHVIVLTLVRDAVRDGDGPWSYPPVLLPALLIGALVIGTVWRRFVGPGPLEAGFRTLSEAVDRPRVTS
jgi:hypothetical protein